MLPAWDGRVVVEMPSSAADLNETLGAEAGTYDGVAAVTATVDGSNRRRAPVHVFVNPEVEAAASGIGADLVMRHELVHVATRVPTSSVEPWLAEGFADYIALRDVAQPDTTSLGRAIAMARRDGVPARLPASTEFDVADSDLQAIYEQAWLACRIIAQRVGEEGLVEVYREASVGVPVALALRRVGLDRHELVEQWQRRLRELHE